MKRLLEKSKPKAEILENLIKGFWQKKPNCDKAIIEIKEDTLTRSGKQNKLYWMWLGVVESETGQPQKDYFEDNTWHRGLHTQFKITHLPKEFYDDGAIKIPESKNLTTKEFSVYLEKVDREMAKWGLMLPHPIDLWYPAMGIQPPTQGTK